MPLDKIEQVKNGKAFRFADIFIYGGAVLLIIALFVIFVIMPPSSSLTGSGAVVEVTVDGQVVLAFDFSTSELEIIDQAKCDVQQKEGERTTVKIFADGNRNKYNIIVFDVSNGGKVIMKEANCSLSHDCTFMEITNTNGVILCVSHRLRVCVKDTISPPVSG